MHPALRRQAQVRPRPTTRTGACNGNCGGTCGVCPPGNGQMTTILDIARLTGKQVAGLTGNCKYNLLHLTNANRAAGIAAAATEVLTVTSQIGLCMQQVVVVTREVAIPGTEGFFTFQNLQMGNRPQWIQGRDYHQGLFGFDSECSCCLPGDCTTIGTAVTVSATNRGALAANVDFYIIGPSVG